MWNKLERLIQAKYLFSFNLTCNISFVLNWNPLKIDFDPAKDYLPAVHSKQKHTLSRRSIVHCSFYQIQIPRVIVQWEYDKGMDYCELKSNQAKIHSLNSNKKSFTFHSWILEIIGEVKKTETNECYRAGASSVYLCLLEIIFVYVLADFASAQTGDTHPKSASGQSSGVQGCWPYYASSDR